jgi:hypothetical protein
MKRKVFPGTTRVEANLKAAKWWAAQKGLRKIKERLFWVGDAPKLKAAVRWTVTIFYEEESSKSSGFF